MPELGVVTSPPPVKPVPSDTKFTFWIPDCASVAELETVKLPVFEPCGL